MQKKSAKRWLFVKKAENINSTKLLSPELKITTSSNLYRNITELPLFLFKKCFLNKKYESLIISGKASEAELLQAWGAIEEQYTEKIAGKLGRRLLDVQAEILVLDGKIRMVKTISHIMSIVIDYKSVEIVQMGAILNKICKTNFKFDDEDRIEEIQRCINRSASLLIKLNIKKDELDSMLGKMEGVGVEIDENYFADALIKFTNHWKVYFDDKISTYEFVQRALDYNKEQKKLKDSQDVKKRTRR